MNIHFAPLQGITDKVYRQTFLDFFEGVDFFYSPYLVCENDMKIKSAKLSDIQGIQSEWFIPQILPGNMEELKVLVANVTEQGYSKVNINIGCPYAMVRNRGRGSALINNPNLVESFLAYITSKTNLKVSVKTRLGVSNQNEIDELLPLFFTHRVEEIFIHCRTAMQMYKGNADRVAFIHLAKKFDGLPLIYNGDILCFEDFRTLENEMSGLCDLMIGRGLLHNPFLAWQIINRRQEFPDNHLKILREFIMKLSVNIINDSNDHGHALNRLKAQSVYFSSLFTDAPKLQKRIKKATTIAQFNAAVNAGFD